MIEVGYVLPFPWCHLFVYIIGFLLGGPPISPSYYITFFVPLVNCFVFVVTCFPVIKSWVGGPESSLEVM